MLWCLSAFSTSLPHSVPSHGLTKPHRLRLRVEPKSVVPAVICAEIPMTPGCYVQSTHKMWLWFNAHITQGLNGLSSDAFKQDTNGWNCYMSDLSIRSWGMEWSLCFSLNLLSKRKTILICIRICWWVCEHEAWKYDPNKSKKLNKEWCTCSGRITMITSETGWMCCWVLKLLTKRLAFHRHFMLSYVTLLHRTRIHRRSLEFIKKTAFWNLSFTSK